VFLRIPSSKMVIRAAEPTKRRRSHVSTQSHNEKWEQSHYQSGSVQFLDPTLSNPLPGATSNRRSTRLSPKHDWNSPPQVACWLLHSNLNS
jgi:hypothetical protein